MNTASSETAAVIGGGLMGCGIAFVFGHGGYPVSIFEPDEARRAGITKTILDICALVEVDNSFVETIKFPASVEAAVLHAKIVIEAGPENLAIKQEIFRDLDSFSSPDCILATNTSAIPISKIAQAVQKPDRVIGAHFWNPPHLIELVEVILGEKTDPAYADEAMTILQRIGMAPVLVKKDVAGFIGNRLQHALKREAIALVADGVCDAQTLDTVVKRGFGARLSAMGPLEQSDLLGLELTLAIHETLMPDLDVTPEPHPHLRDKIRSGKTGAKVGEGFRKWTQEEADEARTNLNHALVSKARARYKGTR